MKLIGALNFERFLEGRGYLDVEETPSDYKFRRNFSVQVDGNEVGSYFFLFEGDLIWRQQFEEKVPGYLIPGKQERVRLEITRAPPSVLDEITWGYDSREGTMERNRKLAEERDYLNRTPVSELPLRRIDSYTEIPFP